MIKLDFAGGEIKSENGQEQERYSSRVALHFSRHGEKENDPNKSNYEKLMTPRGRRQVLDKGLSREKAGPTAVAFGSKMARAQEVAGFEMAGAYGALDITGEESLDGLKEKLNQGLVYGTRLAEDKHLGFYFYNDIWEQSINQAYKGNHGLSFMVNESDKLAKKLGDERSTTYSRAAANVAQFLQKYVTIAPRFDQIIKDPDKKDKYGDVLERFVGSHASVIDCFLCKIVEKIKGTAERDKLVKALGNQGFDETEGFDMTIDTLPNQEKPVVRLVYAKKDAEGKMLFYFNEVIPLEIIEKISKEGQSGGRIENKKQPSIFEEEKIKEFIETRKINP